MKFVQLLSPQPYHLFPSENSTDSGLHLAKCSDAGCISPKVSENWREFDVEIEQD